MRGCAPNPAAGIFEWRVRRRKVKPSVMTRSSVTSRPGSTPEVSMRPDFIRNSSSSRPYISPPAATSKEDCNESHAQSLAPAKRPGDGKLRDLRGSRYQPAHVLSRDAGCGERGSKQPGRSPD